MKTNLPTILFSTFIVAQPAYAQDVSARYPQRMPEWLWDSPSHQHLLKPEEVHSIYSNITKLKQLTKDAKREKEAEELKLKVAKRIASKFSSRDLYPNAYFSRNSNAGTALAIRLDPEFDQDIKATLQSAVDKFLSVALDSDVIDAAFKNSSPTPSPKPEVYKEKNRRPITDELGRKTFSDDYELYLISRPIPYSTAAFAAQMKEALSTDSQEPRLLVISSYKGNVAKNPWWGGARYGFLSDPSQQLGRDAPPTGYLYIRLNIDKLVSPEPGFNDPDLWASKIAHEILHNLWYWHPNYTDPAHRDENNRGDQKAFIVSYENEIYEKLKNAK